MVAFNPSVPETQDPNYLYSSRSPSPYYFRGDSTAGQAVAGLGNLFKTAVTGADEVVKNTIDQALYKDVDTQREGFTGALETIAGIPQNQRVADIQPDSSTLNILPSTSTDGTSTPPTGVDSGISTAQSAVIGITNGKASPLHYIANLDTIAKSLRSEYPAYRDYIDQKMANITGMNPANEYYKQLITGLNSSIQANQTVKEKAIAFTEKMYAQDPQTATVVAHAIATNNPAAVKEPMTFAMAMFSKTASIKAKMDADMAQFAHNKASAEDLSRTASQNISNDTYGIFQKYLSLSSDSFQFQIGGRQITNLDQMIQAVHDVQTGQLKATDAEMGQLGMALQSAHDRIFAEADARAHVPTPNGTYAQNAGANYTSNIEGSLSTLNGVIKAIKDKDLGVAEANLRLLNAITKQDAGMSLLNRMDPQGRNLALNTAGLSSIIGPAAAQAMLGTVVQGGLLPSYQAILQTPIAKIAGQLGPDGKPNTNPNNPFTIRQAVQNLQANNVGTQDPGSPTKTPTQIKSENKMYDALIHVPDKLEDPNLSDKTKLNIAAAAYSPQNRGLVNMFKQDTVKYDPVNGFTVTPGSHMVFDRMTTQGKINQMYRLGQSDPQIWDNFKQWTYNEHNTLMQQDVLDLAQVANNYPNVQLAWNSKNPGWTVNFKPGFNQDAMYQPGIPLGKMIQEKVAAINSSIQPIVAIAQKEGKDPNAAVLTQLAAEGIDPNGQGIPSGMFKAIMNSSPNTNGKPQTLEGMNHPLDNPNEGAANVAHVSQEWGNPFAKGFARNNLTTVTAPNGQTVEVNKKSAEAFSGFLNDLENEGYKVNSLSGYNLRTNKSDPRMLSQHAFGNAIDINPGQNQYGSSKTDMPKNIGELAAKWGLTWGGNFKHTKDPMHFEFTGTIPQSDEGYVLKSNNQKVSEK